MRRREVTRILVASMTGQSAGAIAGPSVGTCTPSFPSTSAETTARIPIAFSQFEPGDVRRYGAVANLPGTVNVDNSQIIQQIFDMVRTTGGRIMFPGGDWSLYLDISRVAGDRSLPVIIEGNGAILRCFSASPPNPCVVFGDNSMGKRDFYGSNVQFRNCNFHARRFSAQTTGDIAHAVLFNGTAAVFYDCSFQYGRVSAFHSMYGQYNEFWSCVFASCTALATSAGCTLDSHAATASGNEVLFSRCKFFTCSNFLVIRGCFLTRVRDTTFQGAPSGGRGGIVLEADDTGQGCVGTVIDGCWFEDNRVPHIFGGIAQGTRIHKNNFYASVGAANQLVFAYCYDLEVTDNVTYTAISCDIEHPPADTLAASLSWHGNNFAPRLSIEHAGPSCVDIHSAGSRTKRDDNMLLTTGQLGLAGVPLVQSDQVGFKTGIRSGTPSQLFQMRLEPFSANIYAPVLVLEVQLFAWQDTVDPSAYAHCARGQRYLAFITNNDGKLRVFIAPQENGVDLGIDIESRRIGNIPLTASVTGSISAGNASVTFSAYFSGAGSHLSDLTSAAIGYKVSSIGANPFTLRRL